jgi:hypothetical protein
VGTASVYVGEVKIVTRVHMSHMYMVGSTCMVSPIMLQHKP